MIQEPHTIVAAVSSNLPLAEFLFGYTWMIQRSESNLWRDFYFPSGSAEFLSTKMQAAVEIFLASALNSSGL